MTEEMETVEQVEEVDEAELAEFKEREEVLKRLWYSRVYRLMRELDSDKEIKLGVYREVRELMKESGFGVWGLKNRGEAKEALVNVLEEYPDDDVQPPKRDPNWENIPEHIRMGL